MKPKFCKSVTQYLNDPEKLTSFRGGIKCNGPDRELHKFDATLTFKNEKNEDVEEILGYDNLILKGCVLKNTHLLYGVATYTGSESKIMLNTALRQPKFSFIDVRVNLILAFLIIVHQLISILFVILCSIYQISRVCSSCEQLFSDTLLIRIKQYWKASTLNQRVIVPAIL